MKTITYLCIIVLLLTTIVPVHAEANGEYDLIPFNELGVSYIPSASFVLQAVRMTLDFDAIGLGGEHVQALLYSDEAGRPGTLLASSPVVWQFEQKENVAVDFALSYNITSGQRYWVVLYGSNSIQVKTTSGNGIILNMPPYLQLSGQETRTFAMDFLAANPVFSCYMPVVSN
jgi:hypothetical protein